MVSGHVLSPVALLAEPLAALIAPERLDVEVDDLVVTVVLGLAPFPVENAVAHVTSPLQTCHWKGKTAFYCYCNALRVEH